MRLERKVAIVTGGASGLGKAYTFALYEEGCRVVIADLKEAADIVRDMDKRGGDAIAVATDVVNEKSVEEMVRKTIEQFEKIDILINNAARTSSTGITRKPLPNHRGRWRLVFSLEAGNR